MNKRASVNLNTGSTGESARCVRSTTESTRFSGSDGSTTQSATESTVIMMVKVRKQPPVDSITHTNFRTNFPTPNKTEIMKTGQIQDRGILNFKLMPDPDPHTDLQPNLQADPPMDLQADLQTDLQAHLQVRMDLQPDLRVHTQGLKATQ